MIEQMQLSITRRFIDSVDQGCVVVAMHPAVFLRLASDGTVPRAPGQIDLARIPEWSEWPTLEIDPETRQVISHEGRHRMARLARAGYDLVDVIWAFVPDPARGMRLQEALAWEWDGVVPDIGRLIPQSEWLR